jgi:flagellar biosynthesis/type III secretory pathway M-ring protein FliF/YscJ
MLRPKRDLTKVGSALAGILLLLLLTVWLPLPTANAYRGTSALTPNAQVTVQATPTEDATITALNKEKLQHENDWWWSYGATILTSLVSTLTLAAAGLFTVVRYFNDRRDAREKQQAETTQLTEDRKAERERRAEEQLRWLKDQEAERDKRAEERFQATVTGLGDEKEGARIGAAILLARCHRTNERTASNL